MRCPHCGKEILDNDIITQQFICNAIRYPYDWMKASTSPDRSCQTWDNTGTPCKYCTDTYCKDTQKAKTCDP